MATRKQLEANRRNAQRSTGPRTAEGRAAVSRNALQHWLTARHVLIQAEKAEEFDELVRCLEADLGPVGAVEAALVQNLAADLWRLRRARQVEADTIDLEIRDQSECMDDREIPEHQRPAYVFWKDTGDTNCLTRLLNLEARIERSFYRTLHELERRRARRAGETVPPPQALDLTVLGTESLAEPAAPPVISGDPVVPE